MSDSLVENALQNVRLEWVEESTVAVPPSNPEWNTLADYPVDVPGASYDRSDEQFTPVGSNTPQKHFQGPEEHTLTFQYLAQQFPVDGATKQDPSGYIIDWSNDAALTSHTVQMRRETADGGNFDAGVRNYVVGLGCKPQAATWPGDAAESRPIVQELTYEATLVRSYILHQPDSATTLKITNNASSSVDVTVENEGASTSETITVSANSSSTTANSYGDVDVVWLSDTVDGSVTVTDGNGTDIVEDPAGNGGIAGTDEILEGERGIPPLGTGGHDTAIGQDPEEYVFRGTSTSFGSGLPGAESIETQDVTVEIDMERTARQGDRGQRIDPGVKTATVDLDTSGSKAQYRRIVEYLRGLSADVTYTLPDGDLVVKSAQPTDAGDYTYSAEDANVSQSVTLAGKGDDVITATHN